MWCKFFLAQGRWQEAESFWAKLSDQSGGLGGSV
jgi:hypothetical protein